jgi:hypothetical protein
VSTIEAIVQALRVLEPEAHGLDALLAAFDSMIDDQLVFIRRGSAAPRTRDKRPPSWRRVPRALVEDFERLVVTYAESSRPDCRGARELVQWAAVDVTTGRTFERLLRPSFGLPSATHLSHMQLRVSDFESAVDEGSLVRDFDAFLASLGGAPLVAAWNQTTLDLFAAATGRPPSRVSLKSAYRNGRGGGTGSLDEVAADEGLVPAPLEFAGRAAIRVARALAIARLLHERACADAPVVRETSGSAPAPFAP